MPNCINAMAHQKMFITMAPVRQVCTKENLYKNSQQNISALVKIQTEFKHITKEWSPAGTMGNDALNSFYL